MIIAAGSEFSVNAGGDGQVPNQLHKRVAGSHCDRLRYCRAVDRGTIATSARH